LSLREVAWTSFSETDGVDASRLASLDSAEFETACTELEQLVTAWLGTLFENGRELSDGQVQTILGQLGKMPPASQPSERAFWAAALINPQPPLNVAVDVRPAMLSATNAQDRLWVVITAMVDSIRKMRKGEVPTNTYDW